MKRVRAHPARHPRRRRQARPRTSVAGAESGWSFLDRVAIVEAGGGIPHGWVAFGVVGALAARAVVRALETATRAAGRRGPGPGPGDG